MIVKLKGLSKDFGETNVLRGLEFSEDISTMAIIGPSGGGKSTLLRILGGLIPMTEGEAFVGDERLYAGRKDLVEYRKKIGFVFQQNGLLKHLSAIDNITMPLIKVHKYSKEDAINRANELLEFFGLKDEAGKLPAKLSGGQQQRIAIARAIAPNPKILLLDEPTSALDPEYTIEVLNMIRDLKKSGIHFIIVTHEMGFARHACDTTMFLSEGQIKEYGPSERIFSDGAGEKLKNFLNHLLEWK